MMLRKRTQPRWARIASLVCGFNVLIQPIAGAATLYWDGSAGTSWATVANWSTVIGGGADPSAVPGSGDDVVFNASGAIANQVATLGANQWAQSLAFGTNTATPITLANSTLTLGAGGITVASGAAAHTISSAIALGTAQTWTNGSANTLTVSGTLTGSGSLNINSATNGVISLSNVANSYTGGVTLTSGIVDTGGNNATFGAGTITFNGGTERSSGTGNRTITNRMMMAANGGTFTGTQTDGYNGPTTVQDNPTLTFPGSGGVNFGGLWTLNSDLTIAGSGAGANAFSGGFTVGGAVANTNRTITLSRGVNAVTLSGTLAGTATNQTLTLAGTGTAGALGNIGSGANAPNLVVNAAPTAIIAFNNALGSYTNTITLVSGIADLGLNYAPPSATAPWS